MSTRKLFDGSRELEVIATRGEVPLFIYIYTCIKNLDTNSAQYFRSDELRLRTIHLHYDDDPLYLLQLLILINILVSLETSMHE